MRFILFILAFSFFHADAQLVARILVRAGSGEKINLYEQIPPNNPNGRKHAVCIFLHGQGERGTPGDTTSANGLPKLKSPGTGPTANLAAAMMTRYQIPNQTDTLYTAWFAPQCNIAYGTWPTWYDSAVQAYIRTSYGTVVDTNRIAIMGLSQGGGGTVGVMGDTGLAAKHNFAVACCPGYWPGTIGGAGTPYGAVDRAMPRMRWFHAANDPTAAVSTSDNLIQALNAAITASGMRGPLCPINYIRFSGATAGTTGHEIWGVVFSFEPSATQCAESNGDFFVFTMPVFQESLQYNTATPRRPVGY